MRVSLRKQNLLVRAAAWYFRDFPIQRGRRIANQALGKILEVKSDDGIRIRLVNPLEIHQRMLLYGDEVFEPIVTRLLSTTLWSGMTFFDIGANIGYYTLIGARNVGSEGQVHAFEPAPAQFSHLELNVRVNRAANVHLNSCAVAEAAGERELFLSATWNHGTHSLGKTLDQTRSCRVQCVTVDEYVRRKRIDRIDVMKVDVEGAELFVFQGMVETLLSKPPKLILFESCENHAGALGHSTRDVKSLIAKGGYRIFRLEAAPEPVEVCVGEIESFANLAATHSTAESCYYEAIRDACRAGLDS